MTLRNSDLSQITANTPNIPDDSVDCGIRALGWCRGPTCRKYARLRTFILLLAIAGVFQGACESYFRISAKEAALENKFNPLIVDWLLVTSGLVQAVFALVFAHFAHKFHPISWLGGSIMIQSSVCIITMIPLILNYSSNNNPVAVTTSDNLCFQKSQNLTLNSEQHSLIILIMLFILQFGLGLGALAFYTIGIVYIDDNSQSIDSPAAIATALGAKIFGLQTGSFLIFGVGAIKIGWWLGWAILALAIFITGFLLSLFPKRLPKTVIHQAAQQIIEDSRHQQFGSQFSTYIDDTAFGPSVKRIFNNKLLMFNLLSIMFIQAGSLNFMFQEESYLQSRFFLPFSEEDGLMQEWQAHFIAYFFRPPVAAVAILVTGLVISKLQLSGRKITGLNISMGIHLLLIYVAFVFIKCDVGTIVGVSGGKLQQPLCSSECTHMCSPTIFQPVCPENSTSTFFSPCYAGCKSKISINNVELYDKCSCGYNGYDKWTSVRATSGSCSTGECAKMIIIFQVLSLMAAALLGATIIGKIIIALRSVLPQDKPLALAMEVMLVGLFTFIPVHLSYDVVTRTTCTLWTSGYTKCLLRETPKHGNILNILTAALIFVGIIFDILVFIFVKGLNLYNCKVTDNNYTPSLYSPIPHEDSPINQLPTENITQNPSPMPSEQRAPPAKPLRTAPKPIVNVFRNPSSLTNSSVGENSLESSTNGVTYAQVVFPPDKRKKNDGTTSPKRMAVRADVPLHHLTTEDVRTQAQQLKSFNSNPKEVNAPVLPATQENSSAKEKPIETNLDDLRPKSPETEF